VDFGRSAGPKTTLAQARVGRVGRRIATVAVSLWQDSPARPVASAQTHFLLG
jgi:acyl-coenzyme A thioesterase PaaI-like protein